MTTPKVSRRSLLKRAAGTAFLSLVDVEKARAASKLAGYPAPITSICWGCNSQWLQPWRELCYTKSFPMVEARIGVVQNLSSLPQSAFNMLRQNGFRNLRVELNWGSVDPTTESTFTNHTQIVTFLQELASAGLRPLILLNANSGYPCPLTTYNVTVTQNAAAGDRSVTLANTNGLIAGRSGFAHLDPTKLAGILVTGIEGQEVTLSQPLPGPIAAGTAMPFVTLNYEPFSLIGSASNQRTIQGWLNYVDLVCRTATASLETANSPDRGFDLEIWNELTFASYFLDINNYYNPALLTYNATLTWANIVQQTADHIAASGTMFQGVRITDGFANTIPWPASSAEPARVTAISKHAYPPANSYPEDEQLAGKKMLDITGKVTSFIPTYQEYYPEYIASATQTESIVRDVGFRANNIGSTAHGRLARAKGGQINPVDVWITETGCSPSGLGITDPTATDRLLTLFTLRSIFFFLGIGIDRVFIYNAFGPTGSFALVNQATPTVASTALLSLRRMISGIKGGSNLMQVANPFMTVMPITCEVWRGASDEVIFQGNGEPNTPSLTTADCVVLLPFQVSQTRIAIVYYVMTLDVRVPLSQQTFVVTIIGQNIQNYSVTAYDPVTDEAVPITIVESARNSISLQILATDIPRAILFDKFH